ncbi:MAG: helix-turn-helix transcriptional regulator [Planctomycetaceae bacterium]|nr:helix-turn-helix transcriptional regulator [Planctomycetaceae bacterium]
MIKLGEAAKYLRQRLELSQRAAAEELGMSHVHLNKIENGTTSPTASMIERYYDRWGIDLYMLAVSKFSSSDRVPASLGNAVEGLRDAWEIEIESIVKERFKEAQDVARDSESQIARRDRRTD